MKYTRQIEVYVNVE